MRWTAVLLAVWLGVPLALQARIGLATKFGDIILENVEPGETYNLREARQVPFIVSNTGDAPTDIVVETVIPDIPKMKEGYEPIPDPTWLRVMPDRLKVQAKEDGFFDIILSVPNKPEYVGKHYQADIWAHSGDKGLFGVGVKGRVRFSTGPGPETLKAEKLKKLMYTLDFEMTPSEIYVTDVSPGEKIDVKAVTGKSIKVANFATSPLALKCTPKTWDGRFKMPMDYEPGPDPSWITFAPDELNVEGDSIGQMKVYVTVPDDKAHRGKKYAYLLQAGVVKGMDLEIYTRLYISVKE